ncbi:MAG TPA: acyl-CoA reductase [Chloroflexota bacterium]
MALPSITPYVLPGLDERQVADWHTLRFGELALRFPKLTPELLAAVAERVAAARDAYLAELPVLRVAELLDRVVRRWLEPHSSWRRLAERLLPVVTGYPEPVVRKGLAGYLATFRLENTRRLLEEEFRDPRVLDEFRPRGAVGGRTRAFGPRLTTHVFSGNVPGLPAQSLACALLVKSASLGKVASEEPLFPALFVQSVAEVDERLAACFAVTWWPGGTEDLEAVAFGAAEAVIAYGSEAAVRSVKARVPLGVRFVAYGHKLSFGVIGREWLAADRADETARRAGYDVAKYDQQGCLSPHVLYVERGGDLSPRAFAARLAEALDRYQRAMPRGRVSLEEAAAIRDLRASYEFRDDAALFESPGDTSWTVVYDEDPTFEASCLNRAIRVKPVDDVDDVVEHVRPVRAYLQTCGVGLDAPRLERLATALGRLGLDRICPLGCMPDPSPAWHHDGRFNLLDLVRWTDLEPDVSGGRWEFAHPEGGIYGSVGSVPASGADAGEDPHAD